MNNYLIYSLIMLVAGLGIPVMAALNGGLGSQLESPALAAVILFLVGLIMAVSYYLFTGGSSNSNFTSITWYFYFGGLFVMFYILSITWVTPRFGVSNAVSFVLLGQLIAMSIIDHYGLFSSIQYSLNIQRLIGLVLMVVGVFMVLSKNSTIKI